MNSWWFVGVNTIIINMKKFGLLFMIMWFLMHFKLLNYVIENEITSANVLKVLGTYIHCIHSKLLHMLI